MTDRSSPVPSRNPTPRRALELDALAAILPMDRRDRLAELLTDDDVETLKHLAKEGMGENSLRALASDLAYLEAWALAATGKPPALARARGARLEIRRPSSLGPGPARGQCEPRHAGRDRRFLARGRPVAGRGPACAGDRAAASFQLGDPASLEGGEGSIRLAGAAIGDTARGARRGAAAGPEKQTGGDARRAREAPRRPASPTASSIRATRRCFSSPSPPAGAGAARSRSCASSSLSKSRRFRRIRPIRTLPPCPACRSCLAAPRPARPTRIAACFWSGARSRR